MPPAIEGATGAQQTQKALKCFLALQSRLPKDSDLWDQYNDISQRLYTETDALQVSCPSLILPKRLLYNVQGCVPPRSARCPNYGM